MVKIIPKGSGPLRDSTSAFPSWDYSVTGKAQRHREGGKINHRGHREHRGRKELWELNMDKQDGGDGRE